MTCFHLFVIALQLIAHSQAVLYKAFVITAGCIICSSYKGVAAMSAANRQQEVAMPLREASR